MTGEVNRFAHLRGFALTDIGRKRKNNEDSVGAFPAHGVWCVADGMGGGDDGEVASAAVVKSVDAYLSDLPTNSADGAYAGSQVAGGVIAAVEEASGWIYRRTKKKGLKGCGSTFVGIVFDATAPDTALALHVGDSRLYRMRGKELKQITKDHSVAEMMGAKDEKDLNPMFRGMILRAVGIESLVEVDQTPLSICEGDVILVCSDGLSRMVPDKRIGEIIREGGDDVEATAKSLVAAANEAGGIDNVTVALVKVGPLPPALTAVSIVRNDDSHSSTTTIETLDREYGVLVSPRLRRVLFAAAIVVVALVSVWALLPSVQRKSKGREPIGPLIETSQPRSVPFDTLPAVAEKTPEPVVADATEKAPEPVVADATEKAPEPVVADATSPAEAPVAVEADVSSPVASETATEQKTEAAGESVERNAIEEELKAARERREQKESAAEEQADANRRAAQDLAKTYESDFAEFASFINSIFGGGTCDRAETLCRRLNLKSDDVDAALCATDLTAEIQALAKRLQRQCRRQKKLLKDDRICAIVEHCDALAGKDPSQAETQRKCFEFIRFITDIRTGNNGRQ